MNKMQKCEGKDFSCLDRMKYICGTQDFHCDD